MKKTIHIEFHLPTDETLWDIYSRAEAREFVMAEFSRVIFEGGSISKAELIEAWMKLRLENGV